MAAEDAKPRLVDLARARTGHARPECGVKTALDTHPRSTEIAELLEALRSKEVQYSTASEVLKEAGIELRADTLSRHTRLRCSCAA